MHGRFTLPNGSCKSPARTQELHNECPCEKHCASKGRETKEVRTEPLIDFTFTVIFLFLSIPLWQGARGIPEETLTQAKSHMQVEMRCAFQGLSSFSMFECFILGEGKLYF